MNISDRVKFTELCHHIEASEDVPPNVRAILRELVLRLDLFSQDLVLQLKKEPTIFIVNPATNPETVEGAKQGDVAIYKNSDGAVEIEVVD